MSKYEPAVNGHLHIKIPDSEPDLKPLIQKASHSAYLSMAEWVRQALRKQAESQLKKVTK